MNSAGYGLFIRAYQYAPINTSIKTFLPFPIHGVDNQPLVTCDLFPVSPEKVTYSSDGENSEKHACWFN